MRLRSDGLASKQVDGRVMLLDLVSNSYFAVGGSGVLILERLAQGDVEPEELVTLLVESYDVSHELATHDVQAFLSRLEASGLVEA